jgi:hypothetical protein
MTQTQAKRVCNGCDNTLTVDYKGVQAGYYCCDEYYCSDKCLNMSFELSGTTWDKHYTDDGDCYWTEWENEE